MPVPSVGGHSRDNLICGDTNVKRALLRREVMKVSIGMGMICNGGIICDRDE